MAASIARSALFRDGLSLDVSYASGGIQHRASRNDGHRLNTVEKFH